MISDREIRDLRRLAVSVNRLMNNNYDAITWDDAIRKVALESSISDDDFFRKVALLAFFVAEDKQLCSLEAYVENLDGQVADLKAHAKGYAISDIERRKMVEKVEACLAKLRYPQDRNSAFDYYQLLIDKIFLSETLRELLSSLGELSEVLIAYYPDAFPEVHLLAQCSSKIPAIIEATASGATKKEIASASAIRVEAVGAIMHRFSQLGLFSITKRGRENLYTFVGSSFDINVLRQQWDWLWAQPYKRLSLNLYEKC